MPIRIKDAGVSVSRRLPAGKLFVEATGELVRGDSGTIFRSTRRREISTVAHVRRYLDLTEATNFEAGVSLSRGHNDAGEGLVTMLYGTDVTLRWRPLSRAISHLLAARTELIWSDRQEPGAQRRRLGGADFLAERVQPGARAVPAHAVRR